MKHVKTFENYKLIENLNEQTFDIEWFKSRIITYIEKVKKGLKPEGRNLFYDILTMYNRSNLDKNSWINLGEKNEKILSDKWFNTFDNGVKQGTLEYFGGQWVGYQTRTGSETKQNGKTYNRYFTLIKTPNNIEKFLNNIINLHKKLKELSLKTKRSILWKTHTGLESMIDHNDSLKIYWYDNSIKKDIDNAVDNWIKSSGVEMSNRSHSYGIDYSNIGDGKSFGQVIGYLIEYNFIGHYLNNNTSTTKELFDYLKDNFNNIIKNIKELRKIGRITDEELKKYIDEYPLSLYKRGYFPKK